MTNPRIGLIGFNGRFGKSIAALYPIVPIARTTSRQNLPCDILIDVSSPEALAETLSANKPMVIGTTGHKDFSLMEKAAQHLPIFYAPNFSLGLALLRKMAELAQSFPADIDIIETHHSQKKDAPSGSALLLAKTLPSARIHSIRSGNIIAELTLILNNAEERLTLSHQAHSRDAFARGALAAAHFLIGKPPGLYSMDDLFYDRHHERCTH